MKHIALWCLTLVAIACSANAEDTLNFVEVSDGIFMFEGEINDIFASKNGRVSNTVFIIGKEAVAVVDTGASLKQGKLIRQAIKSRTQLPIKYVINTHVHLDHIFGNQAFVTDTPEFIAHKNYQQALAAKGRYYQSRLAEVGLGAPDIIKASRLIGKTVTLNLGDRPIRLTAMGRAHTNNDLMIYDVNTATLVAGDLVFVDHCPVIDRGSLAGWLGVLAQLQKLNFSLLIPGHGPLQTDKSALTKMTRYLTHLQSTVREAVAKQMDLHTASNTLLQDEAKHWRLFNEFHKRNIIAAYTELEWE